MSAADLFWGSRGRGFESRRPDDFSNSLGPFGGHSRVISGQGYHRACSHRCFSNARGDRLGAIQASGLVREQVSTQSFTSTDDRILVGMHVALRRGQGAVTGDLPKHMYWNAGVGHPVGIWH
jgi:hypothetical protein